MSDRDVFCDGKDHNGDPIVFADDNSRNFFVEKCGGTVEVKVFTTGMCSNFDQSNSVCFQFHQSVGFQNLWIGFSFLVSFCLLLSAFYSFFMCCKFSHLKYVIKWHVGIFLVNITIWFWIPSFIFNAICQTHLVCGWYVFAIPLVAGCFIASILDLHFSPEAKYFRNQKQAEETQHFLERVRAAKPAIGVKIECFHYETINKRTVEKVTYRERRLFPIDGFEDVSQVPSRIDRGGVTLFHISQSITPSDSYSQDAFLQFKNRYIAANSHRDQTLKSEIEVSIPELSDTRVTTFNGSPPWWASKYCFYILSFLQLSMILRIMFRTRSTVFSILIEKKYFIDPNIQRSYDFDTGLVGPSVVNNFIMSPGQRFDHAQYIQPGGRHVQVPGFAGERQEHQAFINHETKADDLPPAYEEHYKFKELP